MRVADVENRRVGSVRIYESDLRSDAVLGGGTTVQF